MGDPDDGPEQIECVNDVIIILNSVIFSILLKPIFVQNN